MDRKEALTKLRKRFGKQFAWYYNPKAPSAEEREAARARQKELGELYSAAVAAVRERGDAVLAQDSEYQRLRGIRDEALKAKQEVAGKCCAYKFEVGTQNSLFFHVEAQGDSWEEIFAKLAKKDEKVTA